MRVLALDIGDRRVGVAVSDPHGTVAFPARVVDATTLTSEVGVASLVDEWGADLIVVGLPVTMRGEEGLQAAQTRVVAEYVARHAGVPVTFWDERLSSSEARRVMKRSSMSRRDARTAVDAVAAALFLQAFLDSGGAKAFDVKGADETPE